MAIISPGSAETEPWNNMLGLKEVMRSLRIQPCTEIPEWQGWTHTACDLLHIAGKQQQKSGRHSWIRQENRGLGLCSSSQRRKMPQTGSFFLKPSPQRPSYFSSLSCDPGVTLPQAEQLTMYWKKPYGTFLTIPVSWCLWDNNIPNPVMCF